MCKYTRYPISLIVVLCTLVAVFSVALVNNVESLCTPAQVKAEYKAFTELPPFQIAKGSTAFSFLSTTVNTGGTCTVAHRASMSNKTPITLNDYSGACNVSPLVGGWKTDPCCGNSLNQCCTRRDTTISLYDVKSLGALNCSQDVRVEASLAFLPAEVKVGLCDGSSIQAAIDSEVAIIKSSGCDSSPNPGAFVDCLNTKGSYGPLALPSFAAVFGLESNATKEDITPLVISNFVMVEKCYNHKTMVYDTTNIFTKQQCENTLVCPFDTCDGAEICYFCDNRFNCTAVSLDINGNAYDNTTCPGNVICGNGNYLMSKTDCDNSYECDLDCPDCNTTEICSATSVCEGYPVKGVTCAVPAVFMDCPASCSFDKLMDMCLCANSSIELANKFNVSLTNNNFTTPLNAVPNTFCNVGYWELAPPNTVEACHAFKGCYNPQSNTFNSLSTCTEKSCTNGVSIKNVYKFRYGNWVKSSQRPLMWAATQTVSTREWKWAMNSDSQVPVKVYTNMVANMKPELIAKRMTCLTNLEENIITFAACKCGNDVNDTICSNMNHLSFIDTYLVIPSGKDNKTVSESLSFGFISVPPQSSFNDFTFVETRSTFRNPNTPWIVNNSTKSPVGVLFGNGYSFGNAMTGVKLCVNKLSTTKSALPHNLGFAKDGGSGPIELEIPIFVEGASVCAILNIEINDVYYAMHYELPKNETNNNNGTMGAHDHICFGVLSNSSLVCSGFGKCVAPDNCQCNGGRIGKNCEIDSHSNSTDNNGTMAIICGGILSNAPNVCSGFGKCIVNETCQCNGGRTGKYCEINNPNNNNGTMVIICSGILSNAPNVCSGFGICIANETCQCNAGRGGKNCEINNDPIISCNGILSNNAKVCSGFGKCIANETCQCNAGRTGKYCEIIPDNNNSTSITCKGIPSTNMDVCSSGGKCISKDVCQCNSTRFGGNCENFVCYSKTVNSCSGNGVCIGPDKCSCKNGWAGNECNVCAKGFAGSTCSLFVCFGLDQTSKFVCSGNGACNGVDKCACKPGSSGQKCEQFTCGSNENGPCMNHGACVGPNTCVCNSTQAGGFWSGSNCEICQPNYGGSDCKSLACNPSTTCLGRGSCNPDTTCTCGGNFAGPFCRTCINGWYGNSCNVTCDPKKCSGNGFCTSMGTCSCISNNLLGMYAGETCSTCSSGWFGVNCNIKLGSSATFGTAGDRITFEYAFPSFTNNIDCAVILSESSLKSVGSSPVCRWEDRSKNSFQIILGAAASLLPGDILQVKNNDKSFGSLPISGSGSDFLPPNAELRGPKNVSSCTKFFFDASASSSIDRRPLKFSYSISGPGSLSAVNQMLSSVSGSFGFLDASLLSNGEFTLSLTVTNSFNLTAVADFKFTVSSTPSVIVRIPGGASQSVNMGSLFSILPIVDYPSCFFNDRGLIWTWTQDSGPATATITLRDSNRAAIFLENAFPSAGTYTFKVKAVAKASAASSYETTVVLEVIATDLVLMVIGGTTRKTSVTTALSIDFTRSFDPSRSAGSDSFSATCTDLLTNTACSYSMAGVISNKIATFPAGSLPVGEYSIVITYTKGSRSSSQEVYVSMVGYAVLTASVRLTRNDWIPSAVPLGENIPLIVDIPNYMPSPSNPINFTWSSLTDGFTLSEGSTTLSKTTGRSLVIIGSSLSADVTYSVRVDISTMAASGYSVFAFTVNSPPLPGSISATPATSTAGVDTVTISCNGWYDSNSPLNYQFFFYDLTRGIWSTLSGRTTDNQIQAKLPPSPASDRKLRIRARVFDSKNAFVDIETSVVSSPPDLTSGTAALNFLNQSANVADSTSNSAATLSSLSSITSGSLSADVVNQVKSFLVNIITSVLNKQSQVSVSVEDAAETISFISAAAGNLDLVDSSTRGQMLQSTAASLLALASSDKPISSDVANSITSSLSNFIKNVLANIGSSRRIIHSTASDSQSILDSAESLLSSMSKNQVLDQTASISTSSEFIVYTKKISSTSSASYGEVISNNTSYQLPANFTSGFSSSITSISINIKQMSNLLKAIYSQNMNVLSKIFELRLEDADTSTKLSLNGVKINVVLSGNFNLGSLPSKYDCLIWNNSTKVFTIDSTCKISSVSSSYATIEVSQTGTFAVSQAVTATTSTVTPTASKSSVTPKTSKSKTVSSGSTIIISFLVIAMSLLSIFVAL